MQIAMAEGVLQEQQLLPPGDGGEGSEGGGDPPEPRGWSPMRAAAQETCPFCLEALADGRKVILLQPCLHYVHA